MEDWLNLGVYTYLRLGPEVDAATFETKLEPLMNERFAESLDRMGFSTKLVLEPLAEIYLGSKLRAQIGPVGDKSQVLAFSAIAFFVLLLACINFTNLATARSMERAREVGVRKVAGSSRGALVGQFLSESVVLALLSLVVALVLMVFALPALNSIAGKEFALSSLFAPERSLLLVAIAVGSGLLGGLYPAVVLSGMQSVSVIKGSFHSSRSGALLRKGLVSLQFAISIGLIAGTGMVGSQLDFMRSQDLGFDQERVLIVETPRFPREERAAAVTTMKNEFGRLASVSGTSVSGTVPGQPTGRNLFSAEGLADDDTRSERTAFVGSNYFENLGIPVSAGRVFSPDFPTDSDEAVVISETTVAYLGFGTPEEALGKTVDLGGGNQSVIGMVGDCHHISLKEAIEPMLFMINPAIAGFLALRLTPGDPGAAIAEAEATFERLYPGAPFDYFFLDEEYSQQYQAEERLQRISSILRCSPSLLPALDLLGWRHLLRSNAPRKSASGRCSEHPCRDS
ncbi:MAG: putative ABC transport system permease protein [Rhodothermales bacterium]